MKALLLLVSLFIHVSLVKAQVVFEKVYYPSAQPSNSTSVGDLVEAKDGGAFICGSTPDAQSNNSAYLLKLDAAGDSSWIRFYHQPSFLGSKGENLVYNTAGNLVMSGVVNKIGAGTWLYIWELEENGDTIRTLSTIIASSGVDYYSPGIQPMPDSGYVYLINRGVTSSGIHRVDKEMNEIWDWPRFGFDPQGLPINTQFKGVELVDTTLYFCGSLNTGAAFGNFFHARGISGSILAFDTIGIMPSQDIVITENQTALIAGSITTEISPGLWAERLMILKTSIEGDSLDLVIHKHLEGVDASIVKAGNQYLVGCYGEGPVNKLGNVRTASTLILDGNGHPLFEEQFFRAAPDTLDTPQHETKKVIELSDGKLMLLARRAKEGNFQGHDVYVVKFDPQNIVSSGASHTEWIRQETFIYPNPVASVLYLKDSFYGSGQVEITLTDLLGRVQYQTNYRDALILPVNIGHLAPGTYLLFKGGQAFAKVIKQ